MALVPCAYPTATVRRIDARAITDFGATSDTLMLRAGESAVRFLRQQFPAAQRLVVLAGPGNNGGDGYVVARLARGAGLSVITVAAAGLPREGAARRAFEADRSAGGECRAWSAALLTDADLVIDALLGTGLARPVEGVLFDVIAAVNAGGVPVLSLDTPSGLDTDTGAVRGIAVEATATLTFVAAKTGFHVGEGPNYTGRLVVEDLGIPHAAFAPETPSLCAIPDALWATLLPPRRRTAHKGDNGRVLVVAGGPGMPGAARMAGEAALRVGAGLVTVLTHPTHAAALAVGRPELIVIGVQDSRSVVDPLAAADAVVVGPGLGRSAWAVELIEAVFASSAPLVVDADALNHLSTVPRRRGDWCLTPHPGEAARLLGGSIADVQADRIAASRALVARFGGVAVLKGARTLVASGDDPPRVCLGGNPAMAVAGMGDVLAGVIGGLLAQQPRPFEALEPAVALAVRIHAQAGDRAAFAVGQRGMLASDVMAALPAVVNPS
jgi:ADP-dependent NAD(P)H-hydrate dehydratase / NAD(P)H-hydrate epimerase